MPYDILQLNDMLIPELIDVADTLHIQNAKSFDKKTLVDKIMDQQTNGKQVEEPKKKRGRKSKEDTVAEPELNSVQETAPSASEEPAEDGEKKRRARKPKEDMPLFNTPAREPNKHTREAKNSS